MASRIYIFFFILLGLFSCRSQQADTVPEQIPSFNSNECFVRAKILEVIQDKQAQQGPCSEYPCLAKVSVEKVIKCGRVTGNRPVAGQIRIVRFHFTLSEHTNELFPDLQYELPGLNAENRFDAIWEFRPAMEGEKSYPLIYEYRKL